MGHYQVNTEQQHWYGTGRANIIENRREERAPEFDESCKRAFFYPNISLENKSGFLRYFFSISVFNILVIFWSHIDFNILLFSGNWGEIWYWPSFQEQ